MKVYIGDDDASMTKSFKSMSKKSFVTVLKEYANTNNKHWALKDIERVVMKLLEEEQKIRILRLMMVVNEKIYLKGNLYLI